MTPPDTSDSQMNNLALQKTLILIDGVTSCSDTQKKKLEEVMKFYRENWDYLTEDVLLDLASFLTGLDNDLNYMTVLKETKQQKVKYWNNKLEEIYQIMEQSHKWYLNRLKEDGELIKEEVMPVKKFLEVYRQIAEDNDA